jgi:hypothetical protein
MNLHSIPEPIFDFQRGWIDQYFNMEAPIHRFRDDYPGATITAATIQFWREEMARPARVPQRDIAFNWFPDQTIPPPTPEEQRFADQRRRTINDQAQRILSDIFHFRDRLMVSGMRERDLAHVAYTVSDGDYGVLREYVPQEGGYRGPVYERERGTMSVMGITVLPQR